MQRVPLRRIVLALAAAALLTACGLVLGFDDITMVQAPTSINGRVDGLEGEGAVVRIRVNEGDEVVRPNGPFVVEHALVPGAAFRIQARSDGHSCSVDPSEGPIAPDRDLEANVRCVSQNARLGALSFVDGVLVPPFDPLVARYGLAAPLLRYLDGIDGTARPQSETATLALGPGFIRAAPGASVPLSILRDSVTIRVQAGAGSTSDTVVDHVLHATLIKTVPYVEALPWGRRLR